MPMTNAVFSGNFFCSKGSVINFLVLYFEILFVPNDTAIGQVLIKAAPNITAFSIDVNSVTVDGNRK